MNKNIVRKPPCLPVRCIHILFLPVLALLPLILEAFFSASELTEMGIRLDPPWECSQAQDPVQAL